jgi:Xaa-Pro aminopeptidase
MGPDPVAVRAARLAEVVREEGLDGLIVGGLIHPGDSSRGEMSNLRWLTGFTGTSGACVIGPERPIFVTDFRYIERARRDLAGEYELVRAKSQLLPPLAERLSGRVGFDDANVSVRVFNRLEQELGDDVELVASAGLVERLRRHKDAAELEAIAEAARLNDSVFEWLEGQGLRGRSERDVARAAEARMRELGAEPAFPPIVAAAEHGALPHSEPSEREIGDGELVVVDMGAELDGYCSDCTRTYATGQVDGEAAEVYALVLEAQMAALAAVGPGVSGKDADAAARDLIAAAGRGEEFGHGTGHGVGIEVHEAPRVSFSSEDTLEVGDVVTVEPGIYVPGRFGVRIEDLVAITEAGHRYFTSLGKELTVVG